MREEHIFMKIHNARILADMKHGEWSLNKHQNLAMLILSEEVGEVARACLENNVENLKEELIDVAQVCVAWLEGING